MKSSLQRFFPVRLAHTIDSSIFVALLLACFVPPGYIYAQEQEIPVDTWYCGIRLTVSGTYNMTNDISCGTTEIGIEIAGPSITLNLQGHLISGASEKAKTGIKADWGNQTIKGPGKVQGFQTGISLKGLDTVSHVHIERFFGTGISGGPGNKILYNTVSGNGVRGMSFSGARNEIIGNLVTGVTSAAALSLYNGGDYTLVKDNVFVGNDTGMSVDVNNLPSMMTVTGNDMSHNIRLGAYIQGFQATISDNRFNANGQFGLIITGYTFTIQSNTFDNNGVYGLYQQWISDITVNSNSAIGNGDLDIYWVGTGTGNNTWTNNNCDTWSVSMGAGPAYFSSHAHHRLGTEMLLVRASAQKRSGNIP